LVCQLGTSLNSFIGKEQQSVFHIVFSDILSRLKPNEQDESLKEILFHLIDFWLGDK
jgi:hypothetical protein